MGFEAFERPTAPGVAVRVLAVTGAVDTAASGRLADRLAGLVDADGGELIVDLSEVRLLSPAAAARRPARRPARRRPRSRSGG
jgi:sugar/nucleoside kinase (ribokinase family)